MKHPRLVSKSEHTARTARRATLLDTVNKASGYENSSEHLRMKCVYNAQAGCDYDDDESDDEFDWDGAKTSQTPMTSPEDLEASIAIFNLDDDDLQAPTDEEDKTEDSSPSKPSTKKGKKKKKKNAVPSWDDSFNTLANRQEDYWNKANIFKAPRL